MARNELDLGGWCILRMSSAETLTVRDYLVAVGFIAWTPEDRKVGRMPRTRAEYDKPFALMPSYVFVRAEQIGELVQLAMMPNSDTPRFSMFRHNGGFPLVSDASLEALRSKENERRSVFERWRRSRMKAPQIASGSVVRMTEGAWAGLSGKVVEMRGRFALVDIPGFDQPLQISSLLLDDDSLRAGKSRTDDAAQAA